MFLVKDESSQGHWVRFNIQNTEHSLEKGKHRKEHKIESMFYDGERDHSQAVGTGTEFHFIFHFWKIFFQKHTLFSLFYLHVIRGTCPDHIRDTLHQPMGKPWPFILISVWPSLGSSRLQNWSWSSLFLFTYPFLQQEPVLVELAS